MKDGPIMSSLSHPSSELLVLGGDQFPVNSRRGTAFPVGVSELFCSSTCAVSAYRGLSGAGVRPGSLAPFQRREVWVLCWPRDTALLPRLWTKGFAQVMTKKSRYCQGQVVFSPSGTRGLGLGCLGTECVFAGPPTEALK